MDCTVQTGQARWATFRNHPLTFGTFAKRWIFNDADPCAQASLDNLPMQLGCKGFR